MFSTKNTPVEEGDTEMADRSVVLTTFNGQMVEWRMFDTSIHAMLYYTQETARLQENLLHKQDDDEWEIILCDVCQYALSRPRVAHSSPTDVSGSFTSDDRMTADG